MKNGRINSFTDLLAWQERHKLVIMIYEITKTFPKAEMYAMIDQMRRAVASITANIAEGFGRQTYREKFQFYYQAKGSLTELKNFLIIAKDIGYLDEKAFNRIMLQADQADQLLQGLIRKTKSFINP